MKVIGKLNGRRVMFYNGVVTVYGTNIMLVGVKDEKDAVNRCKVNFQGFQEA